MRQAFTAAVAASVMLGGVWGSGFGAALAQVPSTSPAMPPYVAAAVADPRRPAEDRARDIDRKVSEVVAFAGVKPGDTVVDLLPGGGYFTRVFSRIVGPTGRVYAVVPAAFAAAYPQAVAQARAINASGAYPNVTVVVEDPSKLVTQGAIDLVWTSQNYHDLHNPHAPASTALDLDRAVFAALKPGGVFVIEDHAAEQGSGVRDAGTLHRIDQAFVRDEVASAGFVLEAESPVLHNPADPHTLKVFDPAIRGRTDQFVMKFRKPD